MNGTVTSSVEWPAFSGVGEDARNPDGSWRLFVNGTWRDSSSAARLPVVSPADARTVGVVAEATTADVDAAVEAASRAFERGEWRRRPAQERASTLLRLADAVRTHAEDFAVIEALGNGMLLREARGMVRRCAESLEFASGLAQRAYGQTIPVAERYLDLTIREPVGVCALIVPWNGPLLSAIWKLAPAIAFGNSVVLKPSELTPLTALKLAELTRSVGIPAGVVNVLTGAGVVGAAMVEHPLVQKIAFTGSTDTGKAIMAAAARHVKRVTLELGGKSPNIFFADVNIDDAVAGAVSGVMRNCGQICIAGSRIFVQRPIYDEFVDRITAAIARLKIGNGLEKSTQLGPIVSPRQLDRVQSYLASAASDGAEIHGGARLTEGTYSAGNFMAPGIVTGLGNRARMNQEEIFGPVGAVMPFDDEEEAVALANDTRFGLAAGVWTRDVKRALRVAREVNAGNVWINTFGWNFTEAPMGGYRESGVGRENGDAVVAAYTELKNVVIEMQEEGSLDTFRLRS